jgi:outer membrane receptor protein involved in Fe transport
MKLKFSLIALFIFTLGFAQNKGTITGTITDKDMQNETLPFASVAVKGTRVAANADENGNYTLTVSEGPQTLVFGFLGYHSAEVQVTVKAGETIVVNKALASTSVQLADVVIEKTVNREKESALLLEQKKAVEIKQSIGAQELSRKGIGDVEEGLTKITGITKVGSRGIFVRGLEDRYNSLLVNDLAVPSNSPFQKIIPLDLFPTDIVGVVDVYKTFSPNIYGDFAGGTFNIATSKGGNAITKLSIGVGYTTNNNLSDFKLSEDADSAKGFFGLTGKNRQMPSVFGDTPSNITLTPAQSKEAFKTGFNTSSGKSPLNSSIGILHSERFNLKNDAKFSYLFSLNFDNSYTYREGNDNTLTRIGQNISQDNKLYTSTYSYKTNTSSLLGLNYKANRFELTSTTFFLRSTETSIQDQLGYVSQQVNNPNNLIRTNQLNQSNYLTSQLTGKYFLNENKDRFVRAGASFSKTSYQQPDRKFFSGTINGDDITINPGGNNFLRQYFDVDGNSYFSGLAEYVQKFGPEMESGDKKYQFTAGYNGYFNDVESSYRFVSTSSGPAFTTSIDNIDPALNSALEAGSFNFRESSNAQYRSTLKDIVNAGYASILLHFGEKWEVNAGVRFEHTDRDIKYRINGSFDDDYLTAGNTKSYVLPAGTVKYALTEKANLRFAAGLTYTKPVLMEVLPISYINADGTSVAGNQNLVNSDNLNVDLKYEFFPTNTETFSVGVFGKKISNAIERTFQPTAGGNQTTFVNTGDATLYGLEMDFILDLARISDNLKNLSWGFNTSLMTTDVKANSTFVSYTNDILPSAETHRDRQLQGASNWLVNSDLKYQFSFSEKWTNNISLVYGVFGKRIYSVGTNGLDHIYELPVSKLDLVWGSKINEHFDVKFSADNILNPKVNFDYGDDSTLTSDAKSLDYKNYKRGVGFSMSLNYTF